MLGCAYAFTCINKYAIKFKSSSLLPQTNFEKDGPIGIKTKNKIKLVNQINKRVVGVKIFKQRRKNNL